MKVLFPHLSCFGSRTVSSILKAAKKARFDGVEVFVNGITKRRIGSYRELAHSLGLELHFHQAWSWDEDPCVKYWLLGLARYLPQPGYTLEQHIPDAITEPVVVSADRYEETDGHENYWLQTQAVLGKNGEYKIGFREFIRKLERLRDPKLVFDTQHIIEWWRNVWGAENLPPDPLLFQDILEKAWELLGYYVKEIHFNDFDPEKGRNLFPGDGIVPLSEFFDMVRKSGWDGYIVPEIVPTPLRPRSLSWMVSLRERIAELTSY